MDSLYKSRKAKMLSITIHLIVLLIVFIFPEILANIRGHRPTPAIVYIHTLNYLVIFYISYFFLIDRFLFKRKIILFITLSLLVAIITTGLTITTDILLFKSNPTPGKFPPKPFNFNDGFEKQYIHILRFMSRDFGMIVLTIGLSIALKMGLRWATIEQMGERIISERREMELRNLKSQLNPHFLFNTLNNIYVLTAIDTGKAQKAILELSKLLRHTLNDEKEVQLDKELLFMRNYIELMRLRLNNYNQVDVEIYDGPTAGLTIAPLMFISIVENAFKHGISGSTPSHIQIHISLEGSVVSCHVENDLFTKKESDKSGSGIGLANLTRQLSLLYENRYSFSSGIVGNKYISELSIDLKK